MNGSGMVINGVAVGNVTRAPLADDRVPLWDNSAATPSVSTASMEDSVVKCQIVGGPSSAPQYAGLTTSEEIATRQARANERYDARIQRSSLAGLTLRTAWADMKEILVGFPEDLAAARTSKSLWDLLGKNDRLRGLGLVLIVFAVLRLAVAF